EAPQPAEFERARRPALHADVQQARAFEAALGIIEIVDVIDRPQPLEERVERVRARVDEDPAARCLLAEEKIRRDRPPEIAAFGELEAAHAAERLARDRLAHEPMA